MIHTIHINSFPGKSGGGVTGRWKKKAEGRRKQGRWGEGRGRKGEGACTLCHRFSALQTYSYLEPKGEAPEASLACNSSGKPHTSPSGEPSATSQHNKALGTPGALTPELPEMRILLSPAVCSQHILFKKAEKRKSMHREVNRNRRGLTKIPSTFATEPRQTRRLTPCCVAVRNSSAAHVKGCEASKSSLRADTY